MERIKGTAFIPLMIVLCSALSVLAQETTGTPPGALTSPGNPAQGMSVLTQTVVRTQFAVVPEKRVFPAVPEYKPWLYPGLGHIALGEKGRGTGQAVIFSTVAAASISFFIAGQVNFRLCEDKYAEALAEIDYTARSNLLFQRTHYYNNFNILSSYAEAGFVAAAVVYVYSVLDYYYSRKRLSLVSFCPLPEGAELAYRRRF